MTENETTSAPKKLKLTLKLNSSSSSSSNNSTPTTSQLNSSPATSPVKPAEINSTAAAAASVAAMPLSDLPSGLGNMKGRGRPKKTTATKNEASSTPVAATTVSSSSSQPSSLPPTATTTATNEYAADLKSFVASMNSFKCRSWSLHRPLTLDAKNVAGYDVQLSAGLWCTSSGELGSAQLRSNDTAAPLMTQNDTAAFDVTCQCGKVFNNQSKYKKHLKIHDKPLTSTVSQSTPTISLKIKLNTNSNTNTINNSNSNNQ